MQTVEFTPLETLREMARLAARLAADDNTKKEGARIQKEAEKQINHLRSAIDRMERKCQFLGKIRCVFERASDVGNVVSAVRGAGKEYLKNYTLVFEPDLKFTHEGYWIFYAPLDEETIAKLANDVLQKIKDQLEMCCAHGSLWSGIQYEHDFDEKIPNSRRIDCKYAASAILPQVEDALAQAYPGCVIELRACGDMQDHILLSFDLRQTETTA
jgi:hypothetical protein